MIRRLLEILLVPQFKDALFILNYVNCSIVSLSHVDLGLFPLSHQHFMWGLKVKAKVRHEMNQMRNKNITLQNNTSM